MWYLARKWGQSLLRQPHFRTKVRREGRANLARLREEGRDLQTIAERFGVGRQWIRHILKLGSDQSARRRSRRYVMRGRQRDAHARPPPWASPLALLGTPV